MNRKQARKTVNIPDRANPEAVWRMLGLAIRAGKAVTGTEAAEQAMRRQTARLILMAEDVAENTGQKILRRGEQAGVPIRLFGSKDELGHWTGHEARAVVAILDQGFAGRIEQLISAIGSQVESGRQLEKQDHLEE